jgi:hypothetical protein
MALTLGGAVARVSGGITVPDLLSQDFLGFGPAHLGWDTKDTDANLLKVDLPSGGSVNVPVAGFGIGIRDVDLGFFSGRTQPLAVVVDADRDSWAGIGFEIDDVAEVTVGWAASTLKLDINADSAAGFRVKNPHTGASAFSSIYLGNGTSETDVVFFSVGTGNSSYGGARSGGTGTNANSPFGILTNGVERWRISATGHLLGVADNTYDLGADGTTRPRTGYFGTRLVVGAQPGSGMIQSFSKILASMTEDYSGIIAHASSSDGSKYSFLSLAGSRGTAASPSATQSGDTLGVVNFQGYGTNTWFGINNIRGVATENWTSTAHGMKLDFYTNGTGGGAAALRWTIADSGHLLAGADNTYDIGASGATRPRSIYVATDIVAGRNVLVSAGGYVGGIDGTVGNPVFSTGTGGMYRDGSGRLSFTTDLTSAAFAVHSTSGIEVNVKMNLNDVNLVLGATTGTKIGTATTQKLGFWNAAPIVQPSSTGETSGFTAGSGSAVLADSTFTGNSGTKAYTVGDIVKHLKAAGILAAS